MRSSSPREGAVLRPILWCAPLGVTIWAAWSVVPTSSVGRPALQTAEARPDVVTTGEFHATADWFDFIFGGMREPRETRSARPERRAQPRPRPQKPAEAYRTLCVR